MLGLLLASIMSVVNVFTDVSRKKVLDKQYDAGLISFWCKVIAFFSFAAAIGILMLTFGTRPELPDIGGKFHIPPLAAFIIYLMLNAVLEGTAILLNLRALQVSPISYCVPFMAFTPLFLLPAGKIFLGESISAGMVIGVLMVVVGSLVVNRQLFSHGLLEPARAIVREKGSRYMVIVALLLTVTNVLDKWFVTSGGSVELPVKISRALTLSTGKCVMLALFFLGLTVVRMGDWKAYKAKSIGLFKVARSFQWTHVFRDVPAWLILAGTLEAVVLVLQLMAMQYTEAALVISIKRSGIVLAVVLGWFVFKERGITDRVIASFVMLSGVLIFFLTKPGSADKPAMLGLTGALVVAAIALAGMAVALFITHKPLPPPADAKK
jgi:drug/metabolite transporter (DMT)-like permease